jgi:aspartate-semialdehyde dehydrogenase
MANRNYKLALVGVTGLVGREVLGILNEQDITFDLKLLASDRSHGETLEYRGEQLKVEKLTPEILKGSDFAIFTAGGEISREYVPIAASMGIVSIDNSSVFRMDKDVPLIVPEVNPEALSEFKKKKIIANPNCSTVQLVVVLSPLHKKAKIKRVVVSTYQSVSGAGKRAMDELSDQVVALFNSKEVEPNRFPHQIAFNCIPQIDVFEKDGYTKEENKVINETRKILGEPRMGITATAVRVPVFSCHSESVNIETESPLDAATAKKVLSGTEGVVLVDEPEKLVYPLPVDATGTDQVFVGRIRNDSSRPNCLNMWIVADNLRKGAALNAVQILRLLIEKYY